MGGMATANNGQSKPGNPAISVSEFQKSKPNILENTSFPTGNKINLLGQGPSTTSDLSTHLADDKNKTDTYTDINSISRGYNTTMQGVIKATAPEEIDYAAQMKAKRKATANQAASEKKAQEAALEKNRIQAAKTEERQHIKQQKETDKQFAAQRKQPLPQTIDLKPSLITTDTSPSTDPNPTKSVMSKIPPQETAKSTSKIKTQPYQQVNPWPETRMGEIHKGVDYLQNNGDIKGKIDFDLQDVQENPKQGISYLKATLDEYSRRDPAAARKFHSDLLARAKTNELGLTSHLEDGNIIEIEETPNALNKETAELSKYPQTFSYQKYMPRGSLYVHIDFPSKPAKTIDGNQENYGSMDIILNNKKGAIKSQWFKAAYEVTSANAIGVAENEITGLFTDQVDKDYLNFIHHELAAINHENFLKLYNGKEIQGLEGLRGKELDYALVELEQNHVERLTKEYYGAYPFSKKSQTMQNLSEDTDPGGFFPSVRKGIFDFDNMEFKEENLFNAVKSILNERFGNDYIDDAIDTSFGNLQYDQSSLVDRIILGKTIIDQIYEERKTQ